MKLERVTCSTDRKVFDLSWYNIRLWMGIKHCDIKFGIGGAMQLQSRRDAKVQIMGCKLKSQREIPKNTTPC